MARSSEWAHSWLPSLLFLGLAGVLGQGCLVTELNLDYCSNVNGDAFCRQRHAGEGLFCTIGSDACLTDVPPRERNDAGFDGCVQARPSPACHSPCGGGEVQADVDVCSAVADGIGMGGEVTGSGLTGESAASEVDGDGAGTEVDSSTGEKNICGNGVLEDGEDCDGTNLGGESCDSRRIGFDGGDLKCDDKCSFDMSGCLSWSCGNDMREGGEICDGGDLGGQSCTTLGHAGGVLTCNATCTGFDVTECCGDGVRGRGEICDGNDLGGQSCGSQGFGGGTLACSDDCTFETSECCLASEIVCAMGSDCCSGFCIGWSCV